MDKCKGIKKNYKTLQVLEENMSEFFYNLEFAKIFQNITQNSRSNKRKEHLL